MFDYIEDFDNSDYDYFDEDTDSDDSDTEAPYLMLLSDRKISVALFVDFYKKVEDDNDEMLR